nr:glycosyltransferase family 2 protein [Paenibacillus mucilaginosus]
MAVLTVWVIHNLRGWPRPSRSGSGHALPHVSILVPARDEEHNIVRCLESLLRQEYPSFEVICLDDGSKDRTPQLLAELQLRYPKLRVLEGADLPEGWVGKCFACHRLSEAADGRWLLFTDADTVHDPDMLAAHLRTALAREAGLLTGFPRVISRHALGWLTLPMLFFVIALHLPLRRVEGARDPRFTAAHGAFMLYRRDVYDRIGGHAAFRGALVEDMEMARAVKAAGEALVLCDITERTGCEMYRHPAQIWDGFAKNLFPGLGRSTPLLAGLLLFYTLFYIAPLPAAAVLLPLGERPAALAFLAVFLLGALQKAAVDRHFRVPGPWFLLVPASFTVLVLLAVRSWFLAFRGRDYVWKGRRYTP